MEYYTILTDAGRALETAALAGKVSYTLATCALGDGAAMPDPTRTALQNEVWRGPINSIAPHADNPTWLVIETRVPPDDGGFTIREFGIYTDEGVLFAIGNYPELYKPTLAEGTGIDLIVSPICQVSNATSVTLLTDTSIMMATKKYVDERTENIQRRNIGEVFHYQGRSAPFGAVVADGGLVRRNMYPDLWTFAQAQNLVVAETEWQTQAGTQGAVGLYSAGDGVTTFRLPLMTDYFRGTVDPAKIGTWQGDAIRNITAKWGYTSANNVNLTPIGAGYWGAPNNSAYPKMAVGSTPSSSDISFDASLQVPTAAENRPKTLFLLPCIQAYNSVIPNAQADMHGYLDAMNSKLDKVTYNACPIFRASNSSVVSLPANVYTKISWTVHENTTTSINGSDIRFPVAGYYQISGLLRPILCKGVSYCLYINDQQAHHCGSTVYAADNYFSASLSTVLRLTPSDVLDIRLITTAGEATRTVPANYCIFAAHLIRGV